MKDSLKFVNLDKVESFKPTTNLSDYKLISNEKIVEATKKYYQILNKNNNIYVALRGIKKSSSFLRNELNSFFIVGEKAKYYHTSLNNNAISTKAKLIIEINELISKINNIINKEHKHILNGHLEEVDKTLTKEKLRFERSFYKAVLHNYGNKSGYKDTSEFFSVTYGKGKLETSIKFAIERKKDVEIGIVEIYFIPKESGFSISTKKIVERLKKLGVKWFEDIHNEIMLLDGMFPHYLFGFLIIEKREIHKLVLNPWLYNHHINEVNLSVENGMIINQINFSEHLKECGYESYYEENEEGRVRKNSSEEIIEEVDKIII